MSRPPAPPEHRPEDAPARVPEGPILAASRSGTTASSADQKGVPGAATRVSFAKIREPLEVPNLLALQTASFDWLVGNEAWRAASAASGGADGAQGGLEEILDEISPIEDFS